ncbi:hypothetical protein DPMN_071251 [Dreissena polymorpha]|uniref:Uncharacterized protein n=1 Tax=Dreissena polymorpha TaxID=45954 RepID=A0A9D3Z6L8_DREPO|nr:hypothetical protein DPMN_071251 [Dreissena polymorpha]
MKTRRIWVSAGHVVLDRKQNCATIARTPACHVMFRSMCRVYLARRFRKQDVQAKALDRTGSVKQNDIRLSRGSSCLEGLVQLPRGRVADGVKPRIRRAGSDRLLPGAGLHRAIRRSTVRIYSASPASTVPSTGLTVAMTALTSPSRGWGSPVGVEELNRGRGIDHNLVDPIWLMAIRGQNRSFSWSVLSYVTYRALSIVSSTMDQRPSTTGSRGRVCGEDNVLR